MVEHLKRFGSITNLQALGLYRIYRLASVIHRLNTKGHVIVSVTCKDKSGRTYVEYKLNQPLNPKENHHATPEAEHPNEAGVL